MRGLNAEVLRTFVAVAETKSFTLAAQRLGLGQSTVSQHIKRLEDLVGRSVLARDTHSVALTPDGDALLDLARRALDAHDGIERYASGTRLRVRLKLGIAEDFVIAGLHDVLAEFALQHPSVDLELTVGLSIAVLERFDAGEIDVVFAKRRLGDTRGQVAWRERLVWIGRPGIRPDPGLPLPLLLFPPPSITRAAVLRALDAAGRQWRVACTSDSFSGIFAAAQAGMGVAAHSARLIPPGLAMLPTSRFLPELSEVEFVVIGPGKHNPAAAALEAAILRGSGEFQRAS